MAKKEEIECKLQKGREFESKIKPELLEMLDFAPHNTIRRRNTLCILDEAVKFSCSVEDLESMMQVVKDDIKGSDDEFDVDLANDLLWEIKATLHSFQNK